MGRHLQNYVFLFSMFQKFSKHLFSVTSNFEVTIRILLNIVHFVAYFRTWMFFYGHGHDC